MLDGPDARTILAEVQAALKAGIPPGFQQAVAGNAVALALREGELADAARTGEQARLEVLIGRPGPLEALNADLSQRIRLGELVLDDPALTYHLIATTIAKIAIDQPNYPAFRAWRAAGGEIP